MGAIMIQDIAQLKDRLNGRALSVCQHLLPGGRLSGHKWEAGDVGGGAGKSLKVNLTGTRVGVWADFASGDKGDLIDLFAKCRNLDLTGAIHEAAQWLGETVELRGGGTAKAFVRPAPVGSQPSPESAVAQYLTRQRGLTREVLERYQIKATEKGSIVFPYLGQDGVLLQQKFLALDRTPEGKKRIRVEADCEPGLFGWQAIDPAAREVTICEGEIDAMSLWQMGQPALSVPFGGGGGAKQDWIEHEWPRLVRFETIYLAMDMDPEGQKAAREIANRLGLHRCRMVELPQKDANECLLAGMDVESAFAGARSISPEELKSAEDFYDRACSILSGSQSVASGIALPWHGASQFRLRAGEVTIWTGVNGHGKSMLLGHVVLHAAVVGGQRCCIASLEMRPERTLARICRQATGEAVPGDDRIRMAFDSFGEWLWLVDLVGTAKAPRLLEVFEYAFRRYGVTSFVIDSLAKCGIAEEDYGAQKAFVEALCDFANRLNVHVHLVTHTRKQQDEMRPTGKMDVKGTGAITDMAFNLMTIWRNKPKEEARRNNDYTKDGQPDAMLICTKQRNGDWEGKVGLWFDLASYQYLGRPDDPLFCYLGADE